MTGGQPFFARHESFYPRFGWLWKAVTSSHSMPDIFLRSDAPVELGVGKNMVRAVFIGLGRLARCGAGSTGNLSPDGRFARRASFSR